MERVINAKNKDDKVRDQHEIAIHLKEYEVLFASIRTDIERIDRIIGLYAFAVFGIIAYLLKTTDVRLFLENIDNKIESIILVLIIPIINSILLVHATSSFQVILVKSRCATYIIGERLRNILKREVLIFDRLDDLDKRAWLSQRSFTGIVYSVLSLGVSLIVLYRYSYVLDGGSGVPILLLWLAGSLVLSVSIAFLVRHQYINKHYAVLHKSIIRTPYFMKSSILTGITFLALFLLFNYFGYVKPLTKGTHADTSIDNIVKTPNKAMHTDGPLAFRNR